MKPEILNEKEYSISDYNKIKCEVFIKEIHGNMTKGEINWITYPKGIEILLDDETILCNGISDMPDRFPQQEVDDLENQIKSDLMEKAGYEYN